MANLKDILLPSHLQELLQNIRSLIFELRSYRKTHWGRVDPLTELFFDRNEKAPALGYPASVTLYDNVFLCGDIEFGENVFVGQNCMLDGSGGLHIGTGCTLATGTKIFTHDNVRQTLSKGNLPIEREPVQIGDYSYIGANVIILKGIKIGEHCVVGAGSIVTKDVPAYTAIAGNPAKVIGHIDKNSFEIKLLGIKK